LQYEFLKNFPKRMKNVGLYGVLIQNSIQKTSWKQFGFLKFDEQMNLIFAVMLSIPGIWVKKFPMMTAEN